MKHGFIERGDTFTIISDEKHTFTCKNFKTEVTFNLESGMYRPDIVVETKCGNDIVFEMAHKNKKKVQDYIDRWIELDRIIVEVDVPTLTGQNEVKEFKALYFKGKCFNFNKRDGGYYNTIGKLKEEMKQNGKYDVELVRKLDWFWEEVCRYKNTNNYDKEKMHTIIDILDSVSIIVINTILKKHKLNFIMQDYLKHHKKCVFNEFNNLFLDNTEDRIYRLVHDSDYNNKKYLIIKLMCGNLILNSYKLDEDNYLSLINKIRKDIDSNLNYRKREELLNLCRNNTILHKVILNIDTELKSIDKNYTLHDRFRAGYSIISLYYNCDYKIDYDVPLHIAQESDEKIIYNNLKEIIDAYLNTVIPFKDIGTINDSYEELKKKYHDRTLFKDKVTLSPRLAKKLNKPVNKIMDRNIEVKTKHIAQDMVNINVRMAYGSKNSKSDLDIYLYKNKIYSCWNNYKYPMMIVRNEAEEKYRYEDNVNSIVNNVSKVVNSFLLSKIDSCVDCNNTINFSAKDLEFFLREDMLLPKRCKSCRQKRKQNK